MRWLARRDYSQQEMYQKLAGLNIDPSLIEDAMTRLMQEGWVNDKRLAENYVYSRQQKGYGPIRISHELASRGISTDIIHSLINHTDACWLEIAMKIKQKHFRHRSSNVKEWLKQVRFFYQRGFEKEMIETLIFPLKPE